MRRAAPLWLALALGGCQTGGGDIAEGPLLILGAEPQSLSTPVCIETNRRSLTSIPVDIVAEITATRTDGAGTEALLGVEVLDDSYMPLEAEAAAFVDLTDTAETSVYWDFRASDFCVPYQMRFRFIEAPPDTLAEVEWTVEAHPRDDDRAEVTVSIEPIASP